MNRRTFLSLLAVGTIVPAIAPVKTAHGFFSNNNDDGWMPSMKKNKEEWQKELTPEQYHILFEKGTERAGTNEKMGGGKTGTFVCAACKTPLFSSEHKYNSGTGWPSFYAPIDEKNIHTRRDNIIPFMPRTEVVCATCGGHQGHVFKDGPKPTGLRYCINSLALEFIEKK